MAGNDVPLIGVICGPTAGGKSALALACATMGDIHVVSADSRQVYRGFDIGTAKPSCAERRLVPHAGIDVLDPGERASAAWWAGAAEGWLRQIVATRRTPMVVGGTGLYLRALFDVLFDEPVLEPTRRLALQRELAVLETSTLARWVSRLDPARAHLGRTQLLRAIEIALLTGHRVSALHAQPRRPPRWRARYLVVDPGFGLGARIATRAAAMFDAGWAAEVERLMAEVPAGAPAWNASGYGAVRAMVQGTLTREQVMEQVVIETRRYAKRQRTWFRHQLGGADVLRLDPSSPDASAQLAAWFTTLAADARA